MSFITHFACSHFPVLKCFPILFSFLCNTRSHQTTQNRGGKELHLKKTKQNMLVTYFDHVLS